MSDLFRFFDPECGNMVVRREVIDMASLVLQEHPDNIPRQARCLHDMYPELSLIEATAVMYRAYRLSQGPAQTARTP